jgi:S-adenosyl methyltransferase
MPANEWITAHTPQDKPNSARVYDCLLGGYHNFEADRLSVEATAKFWPDVRLGAQANRAFLRRAVHFCLEHGIDQFLDIGSGLPTVGNVHEIAHKRNPSAHVVYVDIDPVAVAHSQAILQGDPNTAAIQADLRKPEQILDHAEVKRLLDWSRPAAVLLVAVVHFVLDDDQANRAMHVLRDALAPGSYVAITHLTFDDCPSDKAEGLIKSVLRTSKARTRAQITQLLDGLELVPPGLVYLPLWRPEDPDDVLLDQPERTLGWGGVGRKP